MPPPMKRATLNKHRLFSQSGGCSCPRPCSSASTQTPPLRSVFHLVVPGWQESLPAHRPGLIDEQSYLLLLCYFSRHDLTFNMVLGPWHDALDGIHSDHSDSHSNTSILETDCLLNIFTITPALGAWIQSGKSDSGATGV